MSLVNLLYDVKNEIETLRRKNELLEAQMRVFNVMANLNYMGQTSEMSTYDVLNDVNQLIYDEETKVNDKNLESIFSTAEVQWAEPDVIEKIEAKVYNSAFTNDKIIAIKDSDEGPKVLADYISGKYDPENHHNEIIENLAKQIKAKKPVGLFSDSNTEIVAPSDEINQMAKIFTGTNKFDVV